MIRFDVPGRVQSQNKKVRFGKGMQYNHPDTVSYQDNVRQYAWVEAQKRAWEPPQCVRVRLTVWNSTIDADNAQKLAIDALKGVLIVDDSRKHMRGVACEHDLDLGEPRLTIEVEACDPLVRPKKPSKRSVAAKPTF